jgi:hypothetical protein
MQLLPRNFAVEAHADKDQTSLICKPSLVAPAPSVGVVQQGRQRDLVVRTIRTCIYRQLKRLQVLKPVYSSVAPD